MIAEPERSRAARAAAEAALVRVVHHYGATPEFVVLGGLVPQLLCVGSTFRHAGTTDIDVQVDLEIANGAVDTARLERALANAEFQPDTRRVWRWHMESGGIRTEVKFELLADLADQPAEAEIIFNDCENLGAVNLRGTGFAARDFELVDLTARTGGVTMSATVNVATLPAFLLAKAAAARHRRKPKDWYDIAFVLLHNKGGGYEHAAERVLKRFQDDLVGEARTALVDLQSNFADPTAQGSKAYAEQMVIDHPALDFATIAAEGVVAVRSFTTKLLHSNC